MNLFQRTLLEVGKIRRKVLENSRIFRYLNGVGPSRRGIALIMVLWTVVLLTLIASEFSFTMRMEVNATTNFKEATQAYYLALAGFNCALAEIMPKSIAIVSDSQGNAIFLDKYPDAAADGSVISTAAAPNRNVKFGTGGFYYQIIDESGKIDLNWITDRRNIRYFKFILEETGVDDDTREIILDSVQDWRDNDDMTHEKGAEDDWYEENYEEMGFYEPYLCKDGYFESVEELLMVRGMTPEILFGGSIPKGKKSKKFSFDDDEDMDSYEGFYEHFTVHNRGGKINLYTTSDWVIEMMVFKNEERIEDLRERRNDGRYRNPPHPFSNISTSFQILSTGYVGEGVPNHTIKAIVYNNLRATKDKIEVKYWADDITFDEVVDARRKRIRSDVPTPN